MSKEPGNTSGGAPVARGILILVVAMLPLGWLLHATAGIVVSSLVCGLLAASLGLTLLAQREAEANSRDPATGLPDRAEAIRRLDGMLAQTLPTSRQGAVIVASVSGPEGTELDAEDRRSLTLLAALRLSQVLRKGDRIVRIGEQEVAAILEPSRGLTAATVPGILGRIAGSFREPFRLRSMTLEARVSIGCCLERDAPAADGRAWLEAAERAAELARAEGEPRRLPVCPADPASLALPLGDDPSDDWYAASNLPLHRRA